MRGNFAAQMQAEVARARLEILETFRTACELIMDEMRRPRGQGGRMPVDTSYLRYSLQASLSSFPAVVAALPDNPSPDYGSVSRASQVVRSAQLGQTVYFAFTAPYAARVNYGYTGVDALGRYYNQPGAFFLEYGLSQWDTILRRAAAMTATRATLGE